MSGGSQTAESQVCRHQAVHLLVVLALVMIVNEPGTVPPAVAQETEPVPTPDPLAFPELPEDPTQVELGENAYYYHCMPCHGDKGQGLTDEWRAVWVEDHQDCWGRGCHAGHPNDEGFPLPHVIPAIAGPSTSLAGFTTPEELHSYLVGTHPPQRPGALTDDEYWALAAYLLMANERLPAEATIGPGATSPAISPHPAVAWALLLAAVVIVGVVYGYGRGQVHR